jgi:hypothetical protein
MDSRCCHCLLVSVDILKRIVSLCNNGFGQEEAYMESVESLDFGGDFSRSHLALTAPFFKKSEEHAVWTEFALLS